MLFLRADDCVFAPRPLYWKKRKTPFLGFFRNYLPSRIYSSYYSINSLAPARSNI